MTEAEWLATKLPLYMLREFPGKWDARKARLFCCACLRRAKAVLRDARSWRFVEAAEQDSENERRELDLDFKRAVAQYTDADRSRYLEDYPDSWVYGELCGQPSRGGVASLAQEIAWRAAGSGWRAPWSRQSDDAEAAEKARQCELIREVFGNPFRPVKCNPSWLTSDVTILARGIYEDRAFDRMPILADALQDAGCENVNVLDHCRLPGEHVRGCWVIDLLLGK